MLRGGLLEEAKCILALLAITLGLLRRCGFIEEVFILFVVVGKLDFVGIGGRSVETWLGALLMKDVLKGLLVLLETCLVTIRLVLATAEEVVL